MARLGAFTKNNLNKQGFGKLDDRAKSRYALPLRFTPAVGTALIVIDCLRHRRIDPWRWLLKGALLPNGMLIDLATTSAFDIYSYTTVATYAKAETVFLFSSTVFLTGSALSFYYGLTVLGYILGYGSHWLQSHYYALVSGSWWYRLIFGRAST